MVVHGCFSMLPAEGAPGDIYKIIIHNNICPLSCMWAYSYRVNSTHHCLMIDLNDLIASMDLLTAVSQGLKKEKCNMGIIGRFPVSQAQNNNNDRHNVNDTFQSDHIALALPLLWCLWSHAGRHMSTLCTCPGGKQSKYSEYNLT